MDETQVPERNTTETTTTNATVTSEPQTPASPPVNGSEAEAGAGAGADADAGAGGAVMRTLNGDTAGDEFAREAADYQMLLEKIDALLERLDLDA